MIEKKLYGILVRRGKNGEYIVDNINDQKKLLSAIATDMLRGNKKARILAEKINKYQIKTKKWTKNSFASVTTLNQLSTRSLSQMFWQFQQTKKTVICGDIEGGMLYTNDKESAMKFLKEDAEKGELPAIMMLVTADLIGGLKELPMEQEVYVKRGETHSPLLTLLTLLPDKILKIHPNSRSYITADDFVDYF